MVERIIQYLPVRRLMYSNIFHRWRMSWSYSSNSDCLALLNAYKVSVCYFIQVCTVLGLTSSKDGFFDQGYPETVGGPVQEIDLESFVFSTSSGILYYHVNLVGSKDMLPRGKSAKGGILGELFIDKLCVVYFIFHAGARGKLPPPPPPPHSVCDKLVF